MKESSGGTPKPRKRVKRRMALAELSFGTIGLHHYLFLGAVLFVSGLLTILVKRNAIGILMGVELILNAANVNLVAFNAFSHGSGPGGLRLDGQVFAIFVIVLAAAEAAVADRKSVV